MNLRSRREFLRLSSMLTAAGALPLLNAQNRAFAAEPDAPVRIGYLPITDATPLLVAHANKLFEAEGLQVEKPRLFRSWAQLAEAFLSGQVNVIHLLSPMTVWTRYGSQARAKVVAWNHMSGSGLTVAPDINDVKDLGGKTVAIPFWYSIHNVVLQQLLGKSNLKPVSHDKPAPDEVKLVVMAPSDMVPALANKTIAGYIVAEPFNALAEDLKVGKVLRFTGDVWKDHACCVVLMHERDLAERKDWTQKTVNAIVKAQAWIRDHRQETADLLSKDGPNKYTPHSKPTLSRVLVPDADFESRYEATGAIEHANWKTARIDFQPYPFASYTEELVRQLKNTHIEGNNSFLKTLDPAFVARDLVDDSFVKNAVAAVGGLKTFGLDESFTRTEQVAA